MASVIKSVPFQEMIDKVSDSVRVGTFNLDIEFLGVPEVTIFQIDELIYRCDYTSAYTDFITLAFIAHIDDIRRLVSAYQNLKCVLTFTPVDSTTGAELLDDVTHLTYRVVFQNPNHILDELASADFLPADHENIGEAHMAARFPISMQLVPEKLYDLRHKGISIPLKGASAYDMLRYVVSIYDKTMECEEIFIATPDNGRIYDNIFIPPLLNFENVFDRIQDKYGVYFKGMGVYYTGNKLYVYPSFDEAAVEPTSPTTLHIYKIPSGMRSSSPNATAVMEGDLHILCDSNIQMTDFSEKNVEVFGNAVVFRRTDASINGSREIVEGGGVENEDNTITIANPSSNTAVSDVQNVRYLSGTNNIYAITSAMYENDCVIASVPVTYMYPDDIVPRQTVLLHKEEVDIYTTTKGVVAGVYLELQTAGKVDSGNIYGFAGSISLRLPPKEKKITTESEPSTTV